MSFRYNSSAFRAAIAGVCAWSGVTYPAFAQDRNDKLASILGAPTNDWRIGHYTGRTDDYALRAEEGQAVLVAGSNGIVLVRLVKVAADSEVTVCLRFGAAGGKATSAYVAAGLKSPDAPNQEPLMLYMTAPAGVEQESVNVQMPPLPGQPRGMYIPYSVRHLPQNRLTWPASVRAWVEQDVASVPSLGRRWLTVRYIIRKDAAQIYLDGLLVRDAPSRGGFVIDPEGYLRLYLFEGMQLAAVRVRALPPEDPVFETVELDHQLNASAIAGRRVEAVDASAQRVEVGGVPFLIPLSDTAGNDHLDIGRSWMRFGLQEGGADPWAGETARWVAGWKREAGRICFRVRNAPYARLHLLAAFDGEPDKTPVVSAQFYRPSSGHPVNFSARVPLFSVKASGVHSLPVTLANGGKGWLHDVTIPLDPEGLAAFADLDHLEFELTKEIQVYRAFPDPIYYSEHGGGLPSGVQVYGITLERPAVEVDWEPDQFANIWTAPETPHYTVTLRNRSPEKQSVRLDLSTASHDGLERTSSRQKTMIGAHGQDILKFPLHLRRYGYHSVKLRITDAQGARIRTRSLAFLHPDTRERGNWEEARGSIFGFWNWNGGHETPRGIDGLRVMVAAGAESMPSPLTSDYFNPEELAYAEAHGMATHFLAFQTSLTKGVLGVEFDPLKPAEMEVAYIAALRKSPLTTPTRYNKPELAVFWAEPHIGPIMLSLPEYYSDPPYKMGDEEEATFKKYLDQFLIGARAIKKTWPNAKCLMPWGAPTFVVPFLRYSKEATELMDGPALDLVLFERMPEMQIHQVTYSWAMWQTRQEWLKTGKPWPSLMTIEAGSVSHADPGSLTMEEEADHGVRSHLVLAAYNVTRQLCGTTPFCPAGAWGEQHYGGGMIRCLPLLNPKVYYSATATLTRQLNRMNYVKAIPTGSASVFCQQYKHYKTGERLYVFWTLRGKRPVEVEVGEQRSEVRGQRSDGQQSASRPEPMGPIELYDAMDNLTTLELRRGKAAFTIGTSPCYVWGLPDTVKIVLGEPHHSDAQPGPVAVRLGNPGDGSWQLSDARDNDYETAHLDWIKKFPAPMSAQSTPAPAKAGDRALAVHLEKPEQERKVMPFYTTLVPSRPILIPGKASHLGLWVRAASDWGRVVYCLRDAQGERWISVGKKGEYNVDDTHCWSAFNFDGWRYLKFEMPGNQPWDCYRDAGTSYWGYYGEGGPSTGSGQDGIVNLPLTLEKIIVERRTHVIKLDELIPADPADVLLGDLYAEYARPTDRTEEPVRLSRLRMPVPRTAPALDNPIRKMTESGVGPPLSITKVAPPEREYDGTRCHVFFEPVTDAKSYDIWVSTYADGRGAVRVGADWTEPGKLLTGLPAGIELFLFATYTDKDGKISKPSPAKRILLKDDFPFK